MDRFQGSPAITDGVVYIPAIDGNLYAFGAGLKYTYLDDLFAQVGANELIVTSFNEGCCCGRHHQLHRYWYRDQPGVF